MIKHPCVKQRVVAIAIVDGVEHIGENWISNKQESCPRQGMETGVGYELCREICGQAGHAEADLVRQVPDLKGATVKISGHTYACNSCVSILEAANCGEIVFEEASHD